MKHFFLLLLAALSLISCSEDSSPVSPGTSQQDKYFSPKKITVYKLNQATEVYNFTHDSTGLVLSEVRDSTDRLLYTYNPNRKPLTKTHDIFYSGSWQNSDSTYYTYDTQNNLLRVLVRSENQNSSQYEYTYNSQNMRTSEINWGSSMGQLIPNYRQFFNYTNNRKVSSTMETYSMSGWQNDGRETYNYDAGGRLDSVLSEGYYEGSWQNDMLIINSYNSAGKIVSQILQLWNGSVWYNYFRATISYDANQCQTASVIDNYNSSTGTWMPSTKWEIQYNSNKKLSKIECFGYDAESWHPVDNSVSFDLPDNDYPFSANGYKMEVEYAEFFKSPSSLKKPGQIDAPLNEMFERLVKEKMAKRKK